LPELRLMPSLLLDMLRLTAWLTLLTLLFAPLERLFTLREGQRRTSLLADLGYYYLNGLIPTVAMAAPLALLAASVRAVTPDTWHEAVASLPLWLSLILGLLIAELGSYWAHRWAHHSPTLWRFHAIHHTPEHLDWLVNSRAHPVDVVFTRLGGLVPLYLLGLDGGGAERGLVPLVVVVIGTVWSFFVHANVRWRFGPLEQLVATPAFHHWHHTNDEHRDKNFAATLPFIDRLFGTLYLPDHFPTVYGIDRPVPPTFHDEVIAPFAGRERASARASAPLEGSRQH